MKKDFLSIIIVIALIFSSVPYAYAASEKVLIDDFNPRVELKYPGVTDYIADCLTEHQRLIDLQKFEVEVDDMIYVFKSAIFTHPEIFFVDGNYIDYSYNRELGTIAFIEPTYIFTRSKLESYEKKFNKAVDSLLEGISADYSDFDKALMVHDRLAIHCSYKYNDVKSYSAYNALVSKKAVCEGYAKAYSYLLSKLGVRSKIINSEEVAHCWNMVKLGGSWYHVDVTSDDPTPETPGFTRHKFFLCSDSLLTSYKITINSKWKNDASYSSDYKCSSTKYDKKFFRNIKTQIAFDGSNYYYVNNKYSSSKKCAFIRRTSAGKTKVVSAFDDHWEAGGGNVLNEGASFVAQRGKNVFFNSRTNIYRYNTSTKKLYKAFSSPSFWSKRFFGIKVQGDYLYAQRRTSDKSSSTTDKMLKFSGAKIIKMPYIRYSSMSLKKNKKFTMKVYCGTGKTTYKTSNKKIATVSKMGVVKAKKKGSCTITATKNGKNMKMKLTVV